MPFSVAQARPRISDYLSSDDERPFISKAENHSLDDAGRLAYANLVEGRDPPRAEWLRLEVALHSRATDDPAVLARFIELSREIGFDYANLLLRDVIMNCGSDSAKQEIPRVRFAFACTKRWETLAPTATDAVRFCQQCKEQVYYCDTVADAESRALAGQCIAIPKPLSDGGVECMAMGRPDPVQDWAGRLFAGRPVRRAMQPGACALIIVHSRDAASVGRHYTLEVSATPISVGRGEHNTIVLEEDAASRSHGRFENRSDGWWVVDDGSTNGTYVNGQQVREALLLDGDRVQIGFTAFKVVGAPRIVETPHAPSPFDGLTGLHNRRHLVGQLDYALQAAQFAGRPLSLVLFDIDRFKRINDDHGHLAGDQVLRELAQLLRPHVRPGDVLARHGGDEFALLLPDTDPESAATIVEQIRTEVAAYSFTAGAHTIPLTLSAGIAQASVVDSTGDRLLAAAKKQLLDGRRQRASS